MHHSKSKPCAAWAISLQRRDLRLSLRVRIIAVLSAVLGLGAIILGIAAWHSASVAAGQAYDRLLSGGTIQIAENVYVQGGVVSLDPPVAAIATLSAYDLVFYKVVDPRGVVVAGYDDLSSQALPAQAHSGVVLEDGVYQGQTVRIATVGRQIDDARLGGWATIVVAQTVDARTALARDLTLKALAVIAAMSVLALLATGAAVRVALKPLTRIEREIAGRRPDDLRPIQTEPPVEIRNLVHSIDEFMRRLSERIAVMQRFIADAAHQIRTPLAALDAQVEMLSSAKPSRRREEHVARIRERTTELARLTSQLLDHAMVIHRAEAAPFAPVDLNALAKSVLAKAVPLSFSREVDISFVPAPAAPNISGDAVSLREAIGNLIDNALAHGARTKLAVIVGMDAADAWVEVADDGEDFAIATAPTLIEPFQKGPKSSGSGLGLAIAQSVARAHHGTLSFAREGEMTKVRISFGTGS
jgi:two-component system sensor histidine kinase TctE